MTVCAYRITEDTICVDGVLFEKNELGNYVAVDEEYKNLKVFNIYIKRFLEKEQARDKEMFNEMVDDMLYNLGIDYPNSFRNN